VQQLRREYGADHNAYRLHYQRERYDEKEDRRQVNIMPGEIRILQKDDSCATKNRHELAPIRSYKR
jgi:hypothetical protein